MNRTLSLALLAALSLGTCLGTASAAYANEHEGQAPAVGKMDREQMREAMKKRHAEMFAKSDKDGDGALSRDEFLASHQERAGKAFEMMDKDKDNKLTKEELKEGRKAWHHKMRQHRGEMKKDVQ